MFEFFVITNHARERYIGRNRLSKNDLNCKNEIDRRIRRDLGFKKINRIISKGNVRYVFTRHSKEFIFEKDDGTWFLRTVIKRSRDTNNAAILKRENE